MEMEHTSHQLVKRDEEDGTKESELNGSHLIKVLRLNSQGLCPSQDSHIFSSLRRHKGLEY